MHEWLKAIRLEHGFTQKELAKKIGLTQSAYCNIERQNRRTCPETAKLIAKELGFDWTWFYD